MSDFVLVDPQGWEYDLHSVSLASSFLSFSTAVTALAFHFHLQSYLVNFLTTSTNAASM